MFPREGCLHGAGPAAHLVAAARRAQRGHVQGVHSVGQPCSALPGPAPRELPGQNPHLRAVVNQHCWVCPLHPFLLPNISQGGEWGCSLSPAWAQVLSNPSGNPWGCVAVLARGKISELCRCPRSLPCNQAWERMCLMHGCYGSDANH